MVKHTAFYSTDRHLKLRLKPYQTPFTSPSRASPPHLPSHLHPSRGPAPGFDPTRMQRGVRGGPLKGSRSSRLSPNCIKDGVQYPQPTLLLSTVNLSQQAWISSFPERPGHYMNKRRRQRGDLTSSYRGQGYDTTNAADKCTLSL